MVNRWYLNGGNNAGLEKIVCPTEHPAYLDINNVAIKQLM
jgi:hypothetical protein